MTRRRSTPSPHCVSDAVSATRTRSRADHIATLVSCYRANAVCGAARLRITYVYIGDGTRNQAVAMLAQYAGPHDRVEHVANCDGLFETLKGSIM